MFTDKAHILRGGSQVETHESLRYLTGINRNFFMDSKICHILSLLIVLLSGPAAGFTASQWDTLAE